MLLSKLFFTMLILAFTNTTQAAELQFKSKGRVIKKLSEELLRKKFRVQDIKVFEPHEQREVVYQGIAARDLMTDVYGKDWEKTEEILFTCVDGYQPSIPAEHFRRADAYFVFAKKDAKDFRVTNKLQNNEQVDLGPYYLVWDNLKFPELKADGASGWPYQVVAMDLIRFADRFPSLAPPEPAKVQVKEGFLAYRKHCLNCHRINGEGADKAIELNYPVNVTEYFRKDWLAKWIDNPLKVRYGTTMPPLNPSLKNKAKVRDAIISYLEAMKEKKVKPKEAKQ